MSDFVDKRGGTYDPVTKAGNPQPLQVKETRTPSQDAQSGADVRPEPLPGPDEGNYPCRKDSGKSAKDRSIKTRADDRRIRRQTHQEHGAQLRLRSLSTCGTLS